jgi:hypothetical protein
MSEVITLSPEDRQGYIKIILLQSIAKRCKEVWKFEPDIDIQEANYTSSTTYIVIVKLPAGRYFYAKDIDYFNDLGMKFAGMKATEEPRLHLYFELNLEKYLYNMTQKELNALNKAQALTQAQAQQQTTTLSNFV